MAELLGMRCERTDWCAPWSTGGERRYVHTAAELACIVTAGVVALKGLMVGVCACVLSKVLFAPLVSKAAGDTTRNELRDI